MLRLFRIFFLFFSFSLLGCGDENSGYYEGYLKVDPAFTKSHGPLIDRKLSGTRWIAVVLNQKGMKGEIEVVDPLTGSAVMPPLSFDSSYSRSHRVSNIGKTDLFLPLLQERFKLSKKEECYEGYSRSHFYLARICLKKFNTVRVEIEAQGQKILSLNVDPFSKPNLMALGDGILTLQEAAKIALETHPASQIEMEHKLQAGYMRKIASAQLAPRLDIAALVGIARQPLSYSSYLGSLGGLAPFLSINRWRDFLNNQIEDELAEVTRKVVQANLAFQVETLIYIYQKDLELNQGYLQIMDLIQTLRRQFQKLEVENLETMDALESWLRIRLLNNVIRTDKVALAQSLGIHDLRIINNVQIGTESVLVESARPWEEKEILNLSLEMEERSLEKKQAKLAVQEAKLLRSGRLVRLMNPSSEGEGSFGFGMIWEGRLQRSTIREVQINKALVDLEVNAKTQNTLRGFNASIGLYHNALQLFQIRKKQLDALLSEVERLKKGDSSNHLLELQDKVEKQAHSYIKAFELLKTAQFSFRIARATYDRMMLSGLYSQFNETVSK